MLERKSVEDSFAKSVLWGFAVAAESGDRVLVDATDFFLRDVHGAAGGLRPGNYRVDRSRSTFFLPNTKGFPKNTEVDMLLTFVNEAVAQRGGLGPQQGPAAIGATGGGGGGGGFGGNLFSGTVGSVTPTADAVTLREHLSFVELPPAGFVPRIDDPRAGYGGLSFVDYSVPIGEPMVFRYMRRHRLVKKDPAAALSEPVTPIQVLGGLGRARRRQEGADRGRDVVEPGVRGGRLPQRLQGRGAARGCRPDGHPLQHDQLGASLDPRLEQRRQRQRSAHRRDHQGHGDPRVAARPSGLHDLRGPALALRDRPREAVGALRHGDRPHPPAVCARSRAHARPRPQLLRQHQGLDLGDGLPASARGAQGRRHHRPLQGLRSAHRRVGQGGNQLRLPPVRLGRRRGGGAAAHPRRGVGAGPALLHQPGHRHPSAHRAVVQRRQPGRRTRPADEGAAGRPRIGSAPGRSGSARR